MASTLLVHRTLTRLHLFEVIKADFRLGKIWTPGACIYYYSLAFITLV